MLSTLNPGATPDQLESAAITRGASPGAVRHLRTHHQHPLYLNQVRDLPAYADALAQLVPIAATEVTAEGTPAAEPMLGVSAPLEPDLKPHQILALWDAGFAGEIIPIIPGGKAPSIAKWQQGTITRSQVERWIAGGSSFGLRTRMFPCLDVDVLNPELTTAIESVIREVFGELPKRTGRPPKFAVPFRAESPFKKMTLTLHGAERGDCGKIEVLGEGQQYVIEGPHPTTKQPYTWSINGTNGGVEILASFGSGALPVLTPGAITERLLPPLIAKLQPLGLTVTLKAGSAAATAPVPQEELLAPNLGAVREAVALIPNGDQVDRGGYVTMAYAIWGATDGTEDGYEIFAGWAAKYEGGDPEYDRTTWEGIKPPVRLGWDYLADRARTFGFNGAAYEFARILPVRDEELVALPTEGQRIAALLQDAGAALMLEADSLPDGQLMPRWNTLEHAAKTTDPADKIFHGAVLAAAHHLRGYKKQKQFCRLLDSQLRRGGGEWLKLDQPTRTALLRAAFAAIVGPSADAAQPQLIASTHLQLPYLVDALLPELGAAMLVGPPNEGKSFIAADLAARVAGGSEKFADSLQITRHGPVLYFTSEDPEGLATRIADWSAEHKLPTDHVYIFNGTPVLTDFGRALEQLQAAAQQARLDGRRPALLIYDTFRDALGAEDENDSGVTSQAVRVARTLGRMVGALALLVAHPPHSDPTRVRGSTAVLAALDVSLSVRQAGKTITATVEKRRRGPKGEQFKWHLRVNGPKAVLHPGPDRSDDELFFGTAQRDQDARLAAELLTSIASAGHPAASKQLNDTLQANCAGMRDASDPKNRSASSRRSRAIQRAIELQWITPVGNGRFKSYIPGPDQPSPLAPPGPEDLAKEEL